MAQSLPGGPVTYWAEAPTCAYSLVNTGTSVAGTNGSGVSGQILTMQIEAGEGDGAAIYNDAALSANVTDTSTNHAVLSLAGDSWMGSYYSFSWFISDADIASVANGSPIGPYSFDLHLRIYDRNAQAIQDYYLPFSLTAVRSGRNFVQQQ